MHPCIGCRQEFMKSAELATPVKPMRRVIPFRRAHERRGEELAFLPAALEIVETPPSPIGRTIGATIILLFCAALRAFRRLIPLPGGTLRRLAALGQVDPSFDRVTRRRRRWTGLLAKITSSLRLARSAANAGSRSLASSAVGAGRLLLVSPRIAACRRGPDIRSIIGVTSSSPGGLILSLPEFLECERDCRQRQ
jgi:hypothetical protein